jgi:hypothetical protein
VFYEDVIEDFSVAVEHENDNKRVHTNEIPTLGRCSTQLKVLITYPRGRDLPTRIERAVRAQNCGTDSWLIIVGNPPTHPGIPFSFSRASPGLNPRKLAESKYKARHRMLSVG